MAERLRAIWERLREDIHRNPGLWIGLGISAVILVIAYLAYRKNQLNTQSVIPTNGYGIPDYGTSSGGSSGGLTYPGYSPYQPASPSLPISPISTPFTSPSVAIPQPPTFSLTLGQPSGPIRTKAYTVQGRIQNPLAPQTAAHVDSPTHISSGLIPTTTTYSGLTAANQTAHRGTTSVYTPPNVGYGTGVPLYPTKYTASQPTSYIIPTTIRPTTVTTRGRVA